jgi:protease secretion system outer membrane protein
VNRRLHPTRAAMAKAVASAVLASLALHAGSASAIGLLAAYDAALKNDPTYREAYYENEAGKENKTIARSGLLPNVSANYGASQNRTDIEATSGTQKNLVHPQYISRSTSVSLRQPLVNFDAAARYRQGVAQSEGSAAQFTFHTQDLAVRLVGAYFDALYATEQLQLVQGQRDVLAEQKRVNDRLFEKGEGTRTDMIETQARLDVAEAQLLEAQDNVTNARVALTALVGADIGNLDAMGPNFQVKPIAPVGFEAWKKIALENSAEVKTQNFAVEIARQEINKQRSGHAPRVDFVASYSKASSDTLNTINQDSTVRSLGVQMSVPLYAGGYASATTRQAVAGHEKAKAALQATTDKVLIEVRKEYGLLVSSSSKIDALVKSVESSKLLVKATEQSIKGGVRINLDLLNAQQQLFTSQRDLAQARYNYLLSDLRLRAAAGTLGYDNVRELAAYFH